MTRPVATLSAVTAASFLLTAHAFAVGNPGWIGVFALSALFAVATLVSACRENANG